MMIACQIYIFYQSTVAFYGLVIFQKMFGL